MKESLKIKIVDYVFLIVGCAIGAFATTAVLIPNGLTSGGLTGIVRIIQSFIDVDFSLCYYAGACIILIVVVVTLGFKEAQKVLIVTLMYPAIVMVFERFNFSLLEEKDLILAAIFCGVFSLSVRSICPRCYSHVDNRSVDNWFGIGKRIFA